MILQASMEDIDDCLKSYLCQLNTGDLNIKLSNLDVALKAAFPAQVVKIENIFILY